MEQPKLNLTPGAWNETQLRGVNSYRAAVSRLSRGQRVIMLREPNNPYDPNAICIKTTNGDLCGYISREQAVTLAPILDRNGKPLDALVAELLTANVKDSNTGVLIRYQIPGAADAAGADKDVDFSKLSAKTLTEEQKQIVLHPVGQHARVLAVAGSGKTSTLVVRVKHLVENKSVNPDSIQILMFNRSIRREFQDKLNDPNEGVTGVSQRVNTFHSLASIIRSYAAKIGLVNTTWEIWETDDEPGANSSREKFTGGLRKVIEALEYKNMIPKNSVGLDEAEEAIGAWKNALIPPERAGHRDNPALVKVYRGFEHYRREKLGLTFDDFVPMAVDLLERSPHIRQRFSQGLRFIFVDEYQDVNYAQQRMIELLAGDHADIMVIGDDDQTLYEWRGARPDYILNKLSQQFANKPLRTYRLTNSFRFGPLIAQCAENSIQYNTKREEKSVVANDFEKAAEIHVMEQGETEHKNSNRWLKEQVMNLLRTKKALPCEIIVLCRMYAQLSMLEAEFIGEIPYRIQGQSPFFKRYEAATLLDYMRVGINYHRPFDISIKPIFLRICNTPNRLLTKSELGKLCDSAHQQGQSLASAIEGFLEDRFCPFNEKQRDNLIDLMVCLEGMHNRIHDAHPLMAGEILKWLEERLGYVKYLENYYGKGEPSYERIEALENFINYAGERPMLTQSFLHHIDQLDTTLGVEKDKQIVMTTVYQIKGGQKPYVIIPNCNEGYMPSRYEAKSSIFDVTGEVQEADLSESIENERRLFYVALTRATKGVFIGACSPDSEQASLSRFLEEIELNRTKQMLELLQPFLNGQRDKLDAIITYMRGLVEHYAIVKNAQKYIESSLGSDGARSLDTLVRRAVKKPPSYRVLSKPAKQPAITHSPNPATKEKEWWE